MSTVTSRRSSGATTSRCPHSGQNRAPSGTGAPQAGQVIPGGYRPCSRHPVLRSPGPRVQVGRRRADISSGRSRERDDGTAGDPTAAGTRRRRGGNPARRTRRGDAAEHDPRRHRPAASSASTTSRSWASPGPRSSGSRRCCAGSTRSSACSRPRSSSHLAEDTGLIVPIGTAVLHAACRQAAQWAREATDAPPLAVSVNLSARQVVGARPARHGHPGARGLRARAAAARARGHRSDAARPRRRVARRRCTSCTMLGVQLSVDDFGARHTSLAHAARPARASVKIDRSFVDRPRHGPRRRGARRRGRAFAPRARRGSHRAGHRHAAPALRGALARLRPRPGLLLRVPAARRDRPGARAPPSAVARAPPRGVAPTPWPGPPAQFAEHAPRVDAGLVAVVPADRDAPRADQLGARRASGCGAPGPGPGGSPCSRTPRHSAHGQLTRSSSRPNTVSVPSGQRTVRPTSRSSSTPVGDGSSGMSIGTMRV